MHVRTNQPGTTKSVVSFSQFPTISEATEQRGDLRPSDPTVYTVCEVAEILRLGKISVYQAIEKGEIPCVRIGRRILIPRHALERLLESSRPVPKSTA